MTYLLFLLLIAVAHVTKAKSYEVVVKNDTTPKLSENEERCFHYTWLADYNELTFLPYVNKSCSDKYALVKPMPLCVNPMVVTENSHEPNSTWLVENKFEAVTCRLMDGYTCAKFTYRFNGKVQNVTRYCTKISVDANSMESGCITSSNGVYETEVCACHKMLGNMPCNGAYGTRLSFTTLFIMLLFITLLLNESC